MGSQGSPVKSYDYLLKFLLVGDSDVGKGEILDSLQDGSAESPYAYSSGESLWSQLTRSCWRNSSLVVMIFFFVRRGQIKHAHTLDEPVQLLRKKHGI